MRTLVVSDLHLSAAHSVLRGAERDALLSAVAEADRVVLLGDLVELRQQPPVPALAAAREGLEAIGAARRARATLVYLAGNHDHGLIAPLLNARDGAAPLAADAAFTPVAGTPLATIAGWLGGERVQVRYPGMWLRDDVWVTHGHYVDRHNTVPTFERLGAGAMARVVREAPTGPCGADAYEAVLGPMYAWLDALAANSGDRVRSGGGASARVWRMLSGPGAAPRGLRRRALGAAFPLAVAGLNRVGLGPLSADVSRTQLRVGALRAMGAVLARLQIAPAHVIFGHTHRAGPLPGDALDEWQTPGATRLHNTGCWVREGVLGGPDRSRSPYRPGFAVWVDDELGSPPRLVNLLD